MHKLNHKTKTVTNLLLTYPEIDLFQSFLAVHLCFCNAVHFSYIRSKLKHKLSIKDSYRSTQVAQQYIIVKNMLIEEASQAYK